MRTLILVGGLAVVLAMGAFTQNPTEGQKAPQKAPAKKGPPPHQLTADEKRRIEAKTEELAGMIRGLRAMKADETLLADVEIYENAARMILEHQEEFFSDPYVDQTFSKIGSSRAKVVGSEKTGLKPGAG